MVIGTILFKLQNLDILVKPDEKGLYTNQWNPVFSLSVGKGKKSTFLECFFLIPHAKVRRI